MTTEGRLSEHPAAKLFPDMPQAEFDELKEDIAANGLLNGIVRYEGRILDGRHRYRACLDISLEPRFVDYDGDDPTGYVISVNLRRRHLNESQRAMIGAELANLPQGGDRSKPQICALTHAQAAAQMNVSPRLVDTASTLLKATKDGRVESAIVEAVRDGKVRLARASQILDHFRNQQQESLRKKLIRRPREKWMRTFDGFQLQGEKLCRRMEDEYCRMQKAGQATPERQKRVREVVQDVAQRFRKLAESHNSVPQDGADHLPGEQDLDLNGTALDGQVLANDRGVADGGDEGAVNG
jgi:predicted HTH domain antitoxin